MAFFLENPKSDVHLKEAINKQLKIKKCDFYFEIKFKFFSYQEISEVEIHQFQTFQFEFWFFRNFLIFQKLTNFRSAE